MTRQLTHEQSAGGGSRGPAAAADRRLPTEELLTQSPSYTDGCDLYPRAMRDIINGCADSVVLHRDPAVTRSAERRYRRSVQHDSPSPEEALLCHPAAARHVNFLAGL
ncbi:hypothetical protein IWQ57_001155 [Coemansia nantahalensis]|uniref:Uncharacterized protein n=1 Tax=Coemansia nantahalensis TaxID=2789366 RepID=A0ACC1K5J5_9FUNG|nr:hypothetical protein IWQ57_001155 [Coemansia nantahalensis]